MRILRLCESEGALDVGAYRAFRDDITLAEALELETALCVIGDQRSAFCEFYKDHTKDEVTAPKTRTNGPPQAPKRDVQALRDELAHRKAALERDERLINAHRAAIAYAASGQTEPEGRMDRRAAGAITASIASHRQVVTYLTGVLDGE